MTIETPNLICFFPFSKRISTCLALSVKLIDANDVEYKIQYLQYIHTEKQAHLKRKHSCILCLIVLLKKAGNCLCYVIFFNHYLLHREQKNPLAYLKRSYLFDTTTWRSHLSVQM